MPFILCSISAKKNDLSTSNNLHAIFQFLPVTTVDFKDPSIPKNVYTGCDLVFYKK